MDVDILISLIIAVIAIIPGVIAVMNSAKKDKLLELNLTAGHFHKINSDRIDGLRKEVLLQKEILENSYISIDDLFKKMYEKPVIIRCQHCNSPNTVSNLNCTQCGAPIN